ncbi:MAG: hypothetical protein DLM70_02625 [Chloroflexi bacterium]|nr:MAG: hypothetical protein DLM70_02625 [Chloroflexota bacterium]
MNRITRRTAVIGAAAVLALAGAGGIISHSVVHANGKPEVAQRAADTDTVQQQVGNQSQADTGVADKSAEATSPDTDTVQSGDQSQADAGIADKSAEAAPAGPDTDKVDSQSGGQTDQP